MPWLTARILLLAQRRDNADGACNLSSPAAHGTPDEPAAREAERQTGVPAGRQTSPLRAEPHAGLTAHRLSRSLEGSDAGDRRLPLRQYRTIRSEIMKSRRSAALLMAGWTGLVGTCLGSSLALAQPETGGVQIHGTVDSQTVVSGSTNLASGAGARALTSVGSIEGGVRIDGRLGVTVQTGHIANVASGPGQQAVTDVGSVHQGSKLKGQTDVVISTGQIINMSDHSGRPACVVIGSTGEVPGC
jgi:hypothetical protein